MEMEPNSLNDTAITFPKILKTITLCLFKIKIKNENDYFYSALMCSLSYDLIL